MQMPLCLPENTTSGPEDIPAMGPPPGGSEEVPKGVDTLGGIMPAQEKKKKTASVHQTLAKR